MKRLLLVVVVAAACILTQSFKPIPNPFAEVATVSTFNYAKFMKSLWLKPTARVKAPVRRFNAAVDA